MKRVNIFFLKKKLQSQSKILSLSESTQKNKSTLQNAIFPRDQKLESFRIIGTFSVRLSKFKNE